VAENHWLKQLRDLEERQRELPDSASELFNLPIDDLFWQLLDSSSWPATVVEQQ